jgi:hypothetical protein
MSAEENVKLWEPHLRGEFVDKNEEVSLATMVEDASVMHVPTQSGGRGKVELKPHYRDVFIPSLPDELKHTVTLESSPKTALSRRRGYDSFTRSGWTGSCPESSLRGSRSRWTS